MYLSHYTTRSGLQGIAASKSFWATNFLCLNDSAEFTYAWSGLVRASLRYAYDRLPKDIARPDFNADEFIAAAADRLKDFASRSDGYGNLFVTSFARAGDECEENDGILTLWARYTHLEGYCLQYDVADVRRMLDLDAMRQSYVWLGLRDIVYGLDDDTLSFRKMVEQIGERMLGEVARETEDWRITPRYDGRWADSYLIRKMMEFCATHKHPAFRDEREIRIIGYPSEQSTSAIFTGPAFRKEILTRGEGVRYIDIGAVWRPGIEPRRIIVGPKADGHIEDVLELFDRRPEVRRSTIPIVA